jgi:hypothetical protein
MPQLDATIRQLKLYVAAASTSSAVLERRHVNFGEPDGIALV